MKFAPSPKTDRRPFAGLSALFLAFLGQGAMASTVMVFNPWDGQNPAQIPLAYVNGLSISVPTSASGSLCGWFSLESPSMPTGIRFESSGTRTAWGAVGSGSSAPIDLSSYGGRDTIWIAPKSNVPKVTTTNPGNVGTCPNGSDGTHVILSQGRCDLLSTQINGSTGCMDLSKIDGTTLDVPESVTRISQEGFVICGMGKVSVPGTDIAYIVDQSGSMTAFHGEDFILVHGADTINFGSCEWDKKDGTKGTPTIVGKVSYKGYTVGLAKASEYDTIMKNCRTTGDPYQVRGKVVQAAINKQAQLAPTSNAAFIAFGTEYKSTKLYSLGTAASRNDLLTQVTATWMDKTNYADPIGWARALLQGAKSSSSTMSPSPNSRKAIILVSDGAPNDADSAIAMLAGAKKVKSPDGTIWTLPNVDSPPIYGFMLSNSASSGRNLQKIAELSGGQYFLIPPLDRDSLNRVMERLMGLLAENKNPGSLQIRNLTNGQVSKSISSKVEGGGFRFPLDSIVGLQVGKNELEMRSVMSTPYGDSTQTIRWTLNVQPTSSHFVSNKADTTLMATCFEPTRLKLRPVLDTTRLFADQRDTKLNTVLDARLSGIYDFPVQLTTKVSKDSLTSNLSMAPNASAARALLTSGNNWTLSLTTPVRNDAIVQTGYGWDTLRAVFHMPRDYRDSAVATLPLLHLAPTGIVLGPDTVSGDTGHVLVTVSDPNLTLDTTSAWIHHRLGDSVRVALQRTAPGIFTGSVAFQQNQLATKNDMILQLGPARVLPLDTIWGAYQTNRDTTLVKRIRPQLRFVDANGQILDSIPFRAMDIGRTDTIRVGLFVNGQLLSQTDSATVATPAWLKPSSSLVRLSKGLGMVVVEGSRPGIGGAVVVRHAGSSDTLVRRLDVNGLRLRFLQPDGTVADDFISDTILRARIPVRLQLWTTTQTVSRSATLKARSQDPSLVFSDASGKVDSIFPIVNGNAVVWVRSDIPVVSIAATFAPDSSWGSATAGSLTWRSVAPDSVVYLDRDGDGTLDQVRAHFALPWNPSNLLVLPWPDSTSSIDLTQAVATPSKDSLTVLWNLASPQSPLTTGWTNLPVPGRFAWNATDRVKPFPIHEAIAPVPVRARLALGDSVDTLRVWMSEPVNTISTGEWIRWGRPSHDKAGTRIDRLSQDTLSSRLVELLVDTSFAATDGDSVRLAVWPLGGISDPLGNGPAVDARWAPLEIVPGPFQLAVSAWPGLAKYAGWTIPVTETPLSLYVRTRQGSPWLTPDGKPANVDPSHYSGALIKTTRNLDGGILYLYDNSGVSVSSVDLAPVLQSFRSGTIELPLRGDAQIWVAWNGTTQAGKRAPSGVYLARVFGWKTEDGKRAFFNQVYRLGWSVP